jgi:hypothetical protein
MRYPLSPAVRQPHLQLSDWQRHAPLAHPQEQFAQSQAPQHVVSAGTWAGVFFGFVIVFVLSFGQRFVRFKRADVRCLTTLQSVPKTVMRTQPAGSVGLLRQF